MSLPMTEHRRRREARLRRIVPVFAVVSALVFLVRIAVTLAQRVGEPVSDLRVYYEGAERLRAGQALYITNVNFFEQPMQYIYPPPLALLLMPLKSYAAAWWVWAAFSLICWFASLGLLLYELRAELRVRVPPLWRPLLLAGLICFTSVHSHMFWGQTQMYILLLLTLAWMCLRRGRDVPAGVLIGIAVAIKVYPVLIFAPLFVNRRWRCLIAGGLSTAAVLAVSYTLVGWDQAYVFAFQVLPGQAGALAEYTANHVTFGATLTHALGDAALAGRISLALRGLVMAAVLFGAWRTRDSAAALALGVTSLVLVTPVVWLHYFVLVYLPWLDALARSPRSRVPLLALAYFLLAIATFVENAPPLPGMAVLSRLFPITGALLLLWCQVSGTRAQPQPLPVPEQVELQKV